jgi:hypothetical protein
VVIFEIERYNSQTGQICPFDPFEKKGALLVGKHHQSSLNLDLDVLSIAFLSAAIKSK